MVGRIEQVGFAIVTLVLAAGLLVSAAGAASPDVVAKNLAENVLGEQTVKQVKVSADGRQIDIAWESATYKESNSLAATRDLLKAEAELATGAIMGIMNPHTIRFAILLGTKTLATGETSRAKGFSIDYALDLRGLFSSANLN